MVCDLHGEDSILEMEEEGTLVWMIVQLLMCCMVSGAHVHRPCYAFWVWVGGPRVAGIVVVSLLNVVLLIRLTEMVLPLLSFSSVCTSFVPLCTASERGTSASPMNL